MQRLLRILIFVFAFILVHFANGQQHTFLHYSSKDGLPQSQINDIIQDNHGFLWIATNGGLSRFDGKKFENFSTLNGLLDNEIRRLDLDEKGNLWIASLTGLTSFNSNQFTFYPIDYPNRTISAIYCDRDTVWISLRANLIKFYNGEYQIFHLSEDPEWRINDIYRKGEDLWILSRKKAFVFQENTIVSTKTFEIPWLLSVHDWNDTSYIISDELGLFKGFYDTIPIIDRKSGLTDLLIRDMAIDKNGSFWFATARNLLKWDGETTTLIDESNGLGYNDITKIYIDRDNVLWLGSDGNGLYKYTGGLITTYTTKEGLNSNLIMGITEDNNAMYTISYNKGLNKIENENIISLHSSDLGLGNGWCIESNENGIWSGYSRGLVHSTKDNTTIYTVEDGLLNNYTLSLFWDEPSNVLHIGSSGGHTEYKNGAFTKHNYDDGFPIFKIRDISKDHNGNIWFAGFNGVAKFNGADYTVYTDTSGLPSNSTYNVEFYKNKAWIGTDNGLCYIENDVVTVVPLSTSPKDLTINLLTNDNRGKLWIGTNNGIYSLNSDSLGSINIDHYGMENGLLGLETNLNASFVDAEGNVFFGFEQGLVRFDRKELDQLEKQKAPKLNLTKLQIYLKDVDWKTKGDSLVDGSNLPIDLRLKPNENYLTFNFSGINMNNPGDIRYRFMLEGAEGELANNWSTPSKNNFATFSNLPSGDYIFKVQAVNGNASWPSEFISYPFTIKTPFYATWWFRLLSALFIVLIAYTFYTWRMRTIRQEQENLRLRSQSKMLALEQQTLNANMNRHFVFNALNSIQYYLNKEDKKSANRYLSRFAKLIRKNLDSSQSKQTTLKEEIERMILYMELEQMRFAHKFDFEFKVDKGINTREISIPSMLFQPYLENSIWHGILPMENHGRIEVEISEVEDECISIKIFDNGIGIDTSMKHKSENQDHISVGMDITKNRLALYEQISKKQASVVGPYEIVEEGNTIGTQVELILPRLNGQK